MFVKRRRGCFLETNTAQEHPGITSMYDAEIRYYSASGFSSTQCELQSLAAALRLLIENLWQRYLYQHQSILRSLQSENTWRVSFACFSFFDYGLCNWCNLSAWLQRELPAAICVRRAAAPASVLWPPLTYLWIGCHRRPLNWLQSQHGSGRIFQLKWKRDVALLFQARAEPPIRVDAMVGGDVSQAAVGLALPIGRWSSAPCSRVADGLCNTDKDPGRFTKSVCVDIVDLLWCN